MEKNNIDISKAEKGYYQSREQISNDKAFEVGWKSKESQYARFEQFDRLLSLKKDSFSITDVGCGNGEYLNYLKSAGFTNFDYVGVDHMPEMIDKARFRFPEEKACFRSIIDSHEIAPTDFIVASGIFNLKFESNDVDWEKTILDTLDVFYEKSSIGFAFNILTSYSDLEYQREELYYASPELFFGHCMRHYSRSISLLHDYKQFDFTLIVFKE